MKDNNVGRRRSRVYGVHDMPGARSSEISLASDHTAISSTSTDSTSTITQESITRIRQSSEGRKRTKKRGDGERSSERRSSDVANECKDIDVFKYLIEEGKGEVHKPEMEMTNTNSALIQKHDIMVNVEEPDLEAFYRGQLSDSGISMGSTIGDPHLDGFMKHPLSTLMEDVHDYSTYAPSVVDPYYGHEHQMWASFMRTPYTPEPMPLSPASIRNYPYTPEYAYRGTPEPPSTGESSNAWLDTAPLTFSDKGARGDPHPLMFRSFAKLNARVLMQIQSNIADLEHELSIIDARIASAEVSTRSRKREHNAAKHLRKEHEHRADLYQEIQTSLEQYYASLTAFQQVTVTTTASKPDDVAKIKSWLHSNVLPSSKIAPMVGDGSDLICLGPRTNMIPDQLLRVFAFSVFTSLVVPLVLFKLTSGVLSRLILLSLTTTITTLVLDRHHANLRIELGQTYWRCIIGCLSISLIAALFC